MIREQKILTGTEKKLTSLYTDKKQVATEWKATRDKQKREGKKHWTVCKTQRRREREMGETEGEFQCPDFSGTSYLTWRLWRVLWCGGGGGGGGGNSSSWTVAKHVSSSVHSSLLSSSPSPDLLPPFLSLSFLSSAQTLRATICPRLQQGKRRGKFQVWWWWWWWWWWESTGPNDQVQSSSTLSNTNTTMSLS